MLGIPESWDILQGELHRESETSPRDRHEAVHKELAIGRHNIESEVYFLYFSLVLVQYFFIMSPFLPFGMAM